MNLMSAAVKEKMLDGLWTLVATALAVLFHVIYGHRVHQVFD